ncbi:hypothetical protein TEA_012641 [Camellia sinensis var. sinensis]|uniref:Inosine/uridine-preferring nucleoside hydrolase domain-containing protein n=1 Tax=Camellia sinensis var. sinensis TaxID=542762 RepID=A0A4S4CWZ1_CAMSN|nr:hypothetical protein TEA_012641 [Camellia sinensis var. sinensis]
MFMPAMKVLNFLFFHYKQRYNFSQFHELLADTDRDKLAQSGGKFAHYLCKILDVYFSYHRDSYCMKGVYLHDPTALLAAVNPSLITYTEGIVRVQTIGITRGLTLFYNKQKRWGCLALQITPNGLL